MNNPTLGDVLVVDDEVDIRLLIAGILEDEGYATRGAGHADEALELMQRRAPSLVVLDIWLQGSRLDGLELLDLMQRDFPGTPVVMISGHGTIETAVGAIKRGAYDFIEKPFKTDRLLLLVQRAIESARLKRENAELRARTDDVALIGRSAAIVHLRQQIQRAAPTGSRVLITGPAGVGKEVVARTLHGQSRRADSAFVVINCAAMEPDRIEEELFGHEPGHARDGARDGEGRKVGILERAHGGTLLFDEVADMPLATQGKILRVLQDQRFHRLGGDSTVEVDIRVLAATSRDLQTEIGVDRFRQDLFYRLNVVPIAIPALAERREDIPLLTAHFMERASRTQGLPVRRIGDDAMAALMAYAWPGNVRQLRNVVDWLLIMAGDDPDLPVRADMLPPEIGAIAPPVLRGDFTEDLMGLPLKDAREVFEREYLKAQVRRFGGNISRTAEFVKMERSALHRKLKGLGLDGAERPAKVAGA